MAKYTTPTSPKTISNYTIAVSSKITPKTVVCDDRGDAYAEVMYGANGNYKKLEDKFNELKTLCDNVLKNSGLTSKKLRAETKRAKNRIASAIEDCKTTKNDLKNKYAITKDIVNDAD